MFGRIRYARPKTHMRASTVVMHRPGSYGNPKMVFRDRDQPIQTLAPNGTDQAFTDGVRLRAAGWRFQDPQTESRNGPVKPFGEDRIAIVQ